jgi:hypothetical protein
MSYSVAESEPDRCPFSEPTSETVSREETVARVLHSGNCAGGRPTEQTFQLADLLVQARRRGATPPEHQCGNSAGVSVQRAPPATVESLHQLSRTLAAQRPGRQPHGAVLASVADLRSISVEEVFGQVVYVLQDGSETDPGHAVIRVRPGLAEGLGKKVREQIMRAFARVV